MSSVLAALCERAEVDSDGRLSLHKIINSIHPGEYPHVHPHMFLACSIPVNAANHAELWNILVELIDSDGRQLDQVVNDTRPMVDVEIQPSWFSFTVELQNIVFTAPGDYQFSIVVNGSLVGSAELILG